MIDPQTWLGWAQYYASQGLAVLPLRGKVPLTSRGVHDASRDPAQLAAWAQQYAGANIGVAIPEGRAVIDVDPRNGGETTIDNLERVNGQLPYAASPAANTGGGGWHLWLELPPGHALPGNLGPGVDVKQAGGYVVAAPSVHPDTGRPYAWLNGQLPHERRAQPLPHWLAAHAKPRGESRVKTAAPDEIDDVRRDAAGWGLDPELVVQDVSPEAIRQAVEAVAPISAEGNRYGVLVKMGGLLNRLGWSVASVEAFAREYVAQYGGRDVEHGVRGCVSGMKYPSGYHALCEMLPAGPARDAFARELDGLHNPYGRHLREARAASAADVMARLAKLEAAQAANPQQADDEFFGWLAARSNGPTPPPIVEGLDIYDGILTGLAGLPHAGKTPLSMLLALSIANGCEWIGRACTKRPVLYLNFEKGFAAVTKRERLARGIGVDPESVFLLNLGDKGALINDKADTLTKIVAIVKRVSERFSAPPVVFVDTLSNSMASINHNDAEYVEPLRDLCTAIRQVASCAVIALMHCRKSVAEDQMPKRGDVEGSGQIVGFCDAAIALFHPEPTNNNRVRVASLRAFASERPAFDIEWAGNEDEPLTCRAVEERAAERPRKPATKSDLQARVLSDLVNAVEAAPEGTHWSLAELKGATKTRKNEPRYVDALKLAIKIAVEDDLLEPIGGSKKEPDGWRKLTQLEIAARRKGLDRTAEIHARNSRMVAESLLEGAPVPLGGPGHAPSPAFGGFQSGTKNNVVPFPGGATPRV